MQDAVKLLKKNGYTFYWNDADKHWWLTKVGKNGKLVRTDPVKAEDRDGAEKAAVERYFRGRAQP